MVVSQENVISDCSKTVPPPVLGSCRLSIAMMLCLGNINLYMIRANMSLAIVCMVDQTEISERLAASNQTSKYSENSTQTDIKEFCSEISSYDIGKEVGEFSWDKTTQGRILGSFFVGYICTQLIGGFLSTRFGCKMVFGLAMLLSAFLTILTPAAARTNVYLLIGVRFLVGFCQGVNYPAQQLLFAKWYPPLDQSRFGSICIAATYVGYVLAFPVAGLLCDYGFDGGWPTTFYVLGIVGILLFIAWMYFMFDSPFLHPRISDAEKSYITEHQGEKQSANRKVVPWLKLFTSSPVWAIVFCHICCTWGEYTFLTNIPSYMKEVLHFNIETNGFLSALPYIGISLWISISGSVADCLRRRNILNTDKVRKLFTTMGCLLPAFFVIGLGFMDCTDSLYAVILLTLSITLAGFQHGGGFMISPLDVAPNYAAIIVGISNTFATLPGFISPITVSELTQNKTREEWQTVFYITAAIYIAGATVFVIFGSGAQQDWDPKENSKDTHLPTNLEGDLRFRT